MPPPEGDEEKLKEGKRLKIFNSKQINAGNNSNKLKNEIRQILYRLYQHSKITKKVYNNLIRSL